jgi:uncharacterized protein (TIGR02145 family)
MKTFRNPFSVLHFPFKTLLIVNFQLLIACALCAQNGITISDFAAMVGSPSTVTFKVAWNKTVSGRDSAWVFVDYNDRGAMTRLLLENTGHTASAGTVTVPNNQGAWVITDTPATGNFTTTVQLRSAATYLAGACVYAVNYFPKGSYTGANTLVFNGTPKYDVMLKTAGGGASSVKKIASPYNVPSGSYVTSFTDATGAPGKCIPMWGALSFTYAPNIITTNNPATFTASATPNAPAAFALSYTWSTPDYVQKAGSGTVFSPAAPAASGTFPVTLTAHAAGHCDLPVTGHIEVLDCEPPVKSYTLSAASAIICKGSGATFTLSGSQGTEWTYQLIRGGTTPGTLTAKAGAGGVLTFMDTPPAVGGYSYTVRTVDPSWKKCNEQVSTVATVVVATTPNAPTITRSNAAATVCSGTNVVFTASGTGGSTFVWTGSPAGTASGAGSVTYTISGAATGTKSASAIARLTSSGTTCVSTNSATSYTVVAQTPSVPAIARGNSAATVCSGTNVVFTASGTGGSTFVWTGSPAGTASGAGSVTYTISGGASGTKSAYALARLTSSGTTCESVNSATSYTVVAQTPAVPAIARGNAAATVCSGTNVVFSASGTGGATYVWTGSPAGTASGAGSVTYTINGSSTGTKSASAIARLTSSGTTCESTNSATSYTVVATTPSKPANPTHNGPKCAGTGITFSASVPNGANGLDWKGSSGISGKGTQKTTSGSGAGNYTAQVRAYLNSGATCYSSYTDVITATINPNPTITRNGGNAYPTVMVGQAIPTIYYTGINSSSIDLNGLLPTGVDFQVYGTELTISGSPAITGTFYFTVYANHTNGCPIAQSDGIIYAPSTSNLCPPDANPLPSSCVFTGSDSWSAPRAVSAGCQLTTNMGTTSPPTTAYYATSDNSNAGYFYNWLCVKEHANSICPPPWSVPTYDDYCQLMKYLGSKSDAPPYNELDPYNRFHAHSGTYPFGAIRDGIQRGLLIEERNAVNLWVFKDETTKAPAVLNSFPPRDIVLKILEKADAKGRNVRCIRR